LRAAPDRPVVILLRPERDGSLALRQDREGACKVLSGFNRPYPTISKKTPFNRTG
jgi:hypothetical protein